MSDFSSGVPTGEGDREKLVLTNEADGVDNNVEGDRDVLEIMRAELENKMKEIEELIDKLEQELSEDERIKEKINILKLKISEMRDLYDILIEKLGVSVVYEHKGDED